MKRPLATALALALAAPAAAETLITVTPPGSQPSVQASPEFFTGSARVDGRFQGSGDARVRGATVTFEPGARTNWHGHPLGHTLIVTAGIGHVRSWDGPVQEITPGDVVWIPPGVKHWHGASALVGVSHIAFSEALDGKTVEWMEPVTDEQYGG